MAAEWAMRLTPEPFRDFLPYTSLSALKVIHTGKVLQGALEVAKRYGSETARERAAQSLATSLRRSGLPIQIASAPVGPLNAGTLTPEAREVIGGCVLGLYFHQLQAQGPWFLDLRPRHFAWDDAQRTLSFFPNGLWYEPDPEFRRRVQSLYAGFYRQDTAALAEGIELYSWESSPSPGFSRRIERLLREHFGAGDAGETRFSIAHFRATFDRIFQETAASRAKLHPELTFLGVGLVGLYLTLEHLGAPLDAGRAFASSAAVREGSEEA